MRTYSLVMTSACFCPSSERSTAKLLVYSSARAQSTLASLLTWTPQLATQPLVMTLLGKHTADLRDAVNVLFAARQWRAMMLMPVQSVWN